MCHQTFRIGWTVSPMSCPVSPSWSQRTWRRLSAQLWVRTETVNQTKVWDSTGYFLGSGSVVSLLWSVVWSLGSPQDKKPIGAVVPSPAAPCHPGGIEGLAACTSLHLFCFLFIFPICFYNTFFFLIIPDRCSLTFDPRTANGHLFLSQENRRAEHLSSGPRPVLAHEARFDHTWQVLCFQGFTHGQHYWELEVSKPWAYLGVRTVSCTNVYELYTSV